MLRQALAVTMGVVMRRRRTRTRLLRRTSRRIWLAQARLPARAPTHIIDDVAPSEAVGHGAAAVPAKEWPEGSTVVRRFVENITQRSAKSPLDRIT
jgi:hypothetical protein